MTTNRILALALLAVGIAMPASASPTPEPTETAVEVPSPTSPGPTSPGPTCTCEGDAADAVPELAEELYADGVYSQEDVLRIQEAAAQVTDGP